MRRQKKFNVLLLALILVITAIPITVKAEGIVTGSNKEEVLMEDDFSAEADGWSTSNTDAWSVSGGDLIASFPVAETDSSTSFLTNSYMEYDASGSDSWAGYHVSTEFTLHKYEYPEGNSTINYPQFAVCTYSSDIGRFEARVTMNSSGYIISLYKRANGTATALQANTARVAWKDGEWGSETFSRIMHVDMSGNTLSAYFEGEENNKAVYDLSNETELTAGSVGLFAMRGNGNLPGLVLNVDIGGVKVTKIAETDDSAFDVDFYQEENWDCSANAGNAAGFAAVISQDSLQLEVDSSKTANGTAAFKGEGSESYQNYRFGADIIAEKNSGGWAWPGLRVYGQNATSAGVFNESYEFFVKVKNSSTLQPMLRKVYLDEAGARKTTNFVPQFDYVPTTGVKIDSATQNAEFRLEMQVMDGVITCYIDGEEVIEYDTAQEGSSYGGVYEAGTFGFFIGRINTSSGTNKIIAKNLALVEAYENPEEPKEDVTIDQIDRIITNDDEKNLMVVEVDDFSSYEEGTVGTWVWEGTDTKGTGDWSIQSGLLVNATDNATLSTIAISDLNTDYEFGSVTTDLMLTSEQNGNLYTGPVAGYSIDTLNYYWLRLEDRGDGSNRLNLIRYTANNATSLMNVDLAPFGIVFERNKWYQVEMAMADGIIYGYIDGVCYLTYDTSNDSVVYNFGQVGVRSSQGSGIFDNFAVKIPREAAEMEENFDSITNLKEASWTNQAADHADGWTVSEGTVARSDATTGTPVLIYSGKNFTFGAAEADVIFAAESSSGAYGGLVAAYNNGNSYSLRLTDNTSGKDRFEIYQVSASVETLCAGVDIDFEIAENTAYNVELFQHDGNIYGYINEVLYLTFTPGEGVLYEEGFTGMLASDSNVKLDNFIAYGKSDSVREKTIVNDTVVENPSVFTDDFEDETVGESPDYWLENNTTEIWNVADLNGNKVYAMDTAGKTASSWLHVFETNVDMTANLYVASEGTDVAAQAGLIVRLAGTDAEVRVAYDYAQKKWYVRDDKGLDFAEQVIWASGTSELALDTWHAIRVRVVDSNLQVWCDDTLVLETDKLKHITTGRVAVYTDKSILYVDNVEVSLLSGQGRVEKAALENYQIDRGVVEQGGSVYWYSDDIVLFSGVGNKLYISEDQGDTFRAATDEEKETYAFFMQSVVPQFLKLNDGYIIKLDNYTGGKSYLSKDGGMTYEQTGKLWEESELTATWGGWRYYGGMNDMIKEVNLGDIDGDGKDNYRVFYCADVRSPGVPANGNNAGTGSVVYHWDQIYYTDDYGYTWQKSEFDTRWISGQEHLTECRIMGDENGVLRMLCTWNYTEKTRCFVSYDYGKTWQDEQALPLLHCSTSSYNYGVDEDGTIYMCLVYVNPADGDSIGGTALRNRLALIRSTDGGATWDYLMDVWRWDDVPTDHLANISQVVNPSLTVTEDFIFVTSGWSEQTSSGAHNVQNQTILKIDKSALTAYEEWPENYALPDDMVKIEVTAPNKLLYQIGEELNLTGGYLTVHYYDGSTKVVPLTDAGVEISEPDDNNYTPRFPAPDMNVTGQKFLRIIYEDFADNFTILVVDKEAEVGTTGDVTQYPVELIINEEEIVEGTTINVENSVDTYRISGNLLSQGGSAQVIVTVNGETTTVEDITVIDNTYYGQKAAFGQEIQLAEGLNEIAIVATDATGNETELSFIVVRAASDDGFDSSDDSESAEDSTPNTNPTPTPDINDTDEDAKIEDNTDTNPTPTPDINDTTEDTKIEKATNTNPVSTPDTGDDNGIGYWIVGVLASLAVIVILIKKRAYINLIKE